MIVNEETLLERALRFNVEESAAFLDRECADAALRVRLEMLQAADADSRWLAGQTCDPSGALPEPFVPRIASGTVSARSTEPEAGGADR